MASIGTYGFLNAKVRAMRSALLTEAFLKGLAASRGFQELFNLLHQTPYRFLSEKGRTATPEALEAELFREEVARVHRLQKYSEGDAGRFVSLFLQRYEAERLKVILRYRRSGRQDDFTWMRGRIACDMPVDALLTAERDEDVIRLLGETPFKDDVEEVPSEDNDFALETAVDRGVFDRLWTAVSSFGRKDAAIAGRILGIEVDLRNLESIGRFRRYYDMPAARVAGHLLPNGFRLNADRLMAIAAGGSLADALSDVTRVSRLRSGEVQENEDDLALIERFLYHALQAEAKRAFGQFPFTIGSLVGYLTLLRIESRNMRVLIQSKAYALPTAETEALLVF